MRKPGYSSPKPLAVLIAMLQGSTATAFQALWSDGISLLDSHHFHHPHMHSHNQLTDLYLPTLAVEHGGGLVSFDQRIP